MDRFERRQAHEVKIPQRLYGKGLFVHFSFKKTEPKVRLQPAFGDAGPRGMYVYPIERNVLMVFAADRAYGWVMQATGRMLDARTFTSEELEESLQVIGGLIGYDQVNDILARHARMTKKGKLSRVYIDVPFGVLYYVIAKYQPDPDEDMPISWSDGAKVEDPSLARKLFMDLGACGFIDRYGIVYSSEPVQAVFFKNDCYRIVELLEGEAR